MFEVSSSPVLAVLGTGSSSICPFIEVDIVNFLNGLRKWAFMSLASRLAQLGDRGLLFADQVESASCSFTGGIQS